MRGLAESRRKGRSSVSGHIHNAFDQSQDKVEFSQRVVVLLLQESGMLFDDSVNVASFSGVEKWLSTTYLQKSLLCQFRSDKNNGTFHWWRCAKTICSHLLFKTGLALKTPTASITCLQPTITLHWATISSTAWRARHELSLAAVETLIWGCSTHCDRRRS